MRRSVTFSTLLLCAARPMSVLAADAQAPAANEAPIDMPATSAGSTAGSSLFSQLDRNRDGYISKEEAGRSAEVSATFDSLDSNHDGMISAAEYAKGAPSKP